MYVFHDVIQSFLVKNSNGFKPAAKEGAVTIILQIESKRVTEAQSLHDCRQESATIMKDQMKMIAHQTIGNDGTIK
jgi:hypothetical protein